MTVWQWVTISPDIRLQLSLDSEDPEIIARVEYSAKENGITLRRIVEDDVSDPAREPKEAA